MNKKNNWNSKTQYIIQDVRNYGPRGSKFNTPHEIGQPVIGQSTQILEGVKAWKQKGEWIRKRVVTNKSIKVRQRKQSRI